jgi:hypothetical protein
VGLKLLIPGVTLKADALVPVPAGLVTLIVPVVAPLGTVAVIEVPDTTLKVVADVPLKLTVVTPVKFVPVSVTVTPIAPLVGVNDEIVGALMTVNICALAPVPPGPVTLIVPVDAPLDTVAVICVSELTVKVAEVEPNLTAVAPVNDVPVITTIVPVGPLVGVNDVMVGEPGAIVIE